MDACYNMKYIKLRPQGIKLRGKKLKIWYTIRFYLYDILNTMQENKLMVASSKKLGL